MKIIGETEMTLAEVLGRVREIQELMAQSREFAEVGGGTDQFTRDCMDIDAIEVGTLADDLEAAIEKEK